MLILEKRNSEGTRRLFILLYHWDQGLSSIITYTIDILQYIPMIFKYNHISSDEMICSDVNNIYIFQISVLMQHLIWHFVSICGIPFSWQKNSREMKRGVYLGNHPD